MAKVLIHREGGDTIEISDLTFEQVKEIAGVNGHRSSAPPSLRKQNPNTSLISEAKESDFQGFLGAILESERGRAFITALRDHPNGIDIHDLVPRLKLNDARQVGGFTGGGVAKLARRFGIKMGDIYKSKITFPGGKRTRLFYPGKLVRNGAILKPAV